MNDGVNIDAKDDGDDDHQVGDVLLDIRDLASKRRENCQEFEHLLLASVTILGKGEQKENRPF